MTMRLRAFLATVLALLPVGGQAMPDVRPRLLFQGDAGVEEQAVVVRWRRARIGVEAHFPDSTLLDVEVDVRDGVLSWQDLFLDLPLGETRLTLGQFRPSYGLDEETSGSATSLLERAAFTDAFGFQKRLGVGIDTPLGADTSLSLGLFGRPIDAPPSQRDAWSVTGRLVYAPKQEGRQGHGALNATWFTQREGDLSHTLRPPLLATLPPGATVTLPDIRHFWGMGLEAALVQGPLWLAGEVYARHIPVPARDPLFWGGYAEVGRMVRGVRPYRDGKFTGMAARALWMVMRLDHLDLTSAGYDGGQQSALLLGAGWKPLEPMTVQLNIGPHRLATAQAEAIRVGVGGRVQWQW